MGTETGILRIKDREFPVNDAILQGTVDPIAGLRWCLRVCAEDWVHEDEFGNAQTWSPNAYVEQFAWEPKSRDEFTKYPIKIEDGFDFCEGTILPGCKLCCLYVVEHDYLDQNLIRFTQRRGNTLQMTWTAKCANNWDEEYGKDLDLLIESEVQFLGFNTTLHNELEARAILEKQFEHRGLKFHREPGQRESFFLPE